MGGGDWGVAWHFLTQLPYHSLLTKPSVSVTQGPLDPMLYKYSVRFIVKCLFVIGNSGDGVIPNF